MPFLIILVGITLALVAYNNTQDQLASSLEQDLPGFLKWGAAVVAIVGLGYIPGFNRFSRLLLGLVILVIVLKNYSAILQSFEGLSSTAAGQAQQAVSATPTTPEAAYAAAIDPSAGFAASASGGFGSGLPIADLTNSLFPGSVAGLFPAIGGGGGSAFDPLTGAVSGIPELGDIASGIFG
jgi:hypothetical protein